MIGRGSGASSSSTVSTYQKLSRTAPSRSRAIRTIAASAARLNVFDHAEPPYPTASKSASLIASFEINGTPRACANGSARLVFPEAASPLTTTKPRLKDTPPTLHYEPLRVSPLIGKPSSPLVVATYGDCD